MTIVSDFLVMYRNRTFQVPMLVIDLRSFGLAASCLQYFIFLRYERPLAPYFWNVCRFGWCFCNPRYVQAFAFEQRINPLKGSRSIHQSSRKEQHNTYTIANHERPYMFFYYITMFFIMQNRILVLSIDLFAERLR